MFNTPSVYCFEINLGYRFILENSHAPGRSRIPAGCPSATQGSLGLFVAVPELEVIKMGLDLSTIGVYTQKLTSTTVAIRKLYG